MCETLVLTVLDQVNSGNLGTWQEGEEEKTIRHQRSTSRLLRLPKSRALVGVRPKSKYQREVLHIIERAASWHAE